MPNFKISTVLPLIFLCTISCKAQKDSAFYKRPTGNAVTKGLVKDFGADNDFATDDSDLFQKAINQLSKQGGGKLTVPKGDYALREVAMKSNVHIVIDHEAVIRPYELTKADMEAGIKKNKKGKPKKMSKNYKMFAFGENSSIKNISITSSQKGKMFTIDLTQVSNPNVGVFVLRNVDNFYFSDIIIKDKQTTFSSFTFGITPYNGSYHYPQNGIIRNCTTTNADYGYGLVQTQAAKNVFFDNISGQGGVTLRLETGLKKMNDLQIGGVHDISARNVASVDGNAALMISPHAMKNGIVTIDGVTAVNSGFAVRIGNAYVAKKYDQTLNLEPGSFDPKSSVKNITATFGTKAQVKPKHFKYIPKKYHNKERTAATPITNVHSNPLSTKSSHSVFSVSVAAVGYFTGKDVTCTTKKGDISKFDAGYTIQIDESSIKAIGFTDQKPIIDATDNVLSDCTLTNK